MNKHLKIATALTFVAILFFSIGGTAQSLENSLLWKVEKKKCKTSYLFGTIHMLPQADFVMMPKVEKALGESELLILEMDITQPGMQLQMMQYAMMKDGHTLDEYLADSTYKKVDVAVQQATGLPLGMMNTMKPFIISTFLVSQYTGAEPVSFEVVLAEMATEDSKPIFGLETLEMQMGVFDAIPYQEQADGLAEMVETPSDMEALYADMVDAYTQEDLNLLSQMMAEEMTGEGETEELLIKRNLNWIPIIEAQMKAQHNFIAVGAAHLGSEDGLIYLLRAAGYKVTPVLN